MYIHVNEDHLTRGNPGLAHSCPVVLAIQEKTGRRAFVTRADANASRRWVAGFTDIHNEHFLSPKVGLLLEKIDKGLTVRPFRFKLPKEMQKELE